MKPEEVAIKDGKAFKTTEVKVIEKWIHPKYKMIKYKENRITDTGLLLVAELRPMEENLPRFLFRWDEKAESLDVDITDVSEEIKRKFKRGREGYEGHHPKRVPDEKEIIFEACIRTPQGKVFEGKISFGLHRELEASKSLGLLCNVVMVVRRRLRRLRNAVKDVVRRKEGD